MDPITIAALIGAGSGLLKNQREQKMAKEQDRFRKAAITYSPWTGMSDPGGMQTQGLLGNLFGGAAQGAMVGSMLGPWSLFGDAAGAASAGTSAGGMGEALLP